jgi:hypothetical protein
MSHEYNILQGERVCDRGDTIYSDVRAGIIIMIYSCLKAELEGVGI